MKQKLKSLRFRMLLPVVAMTLFVVILLTAVFSRAYIGMILQQEQEVNAVGFDTVSRSVSPLIDTSISEVRRILADERVAAYARHEYASVTDLIHARIRCRDYLRSEVARHEGIFGLLFMREDGSLFGTLPEGNFFLDDPQENPLPEDMKAQILNTPRAQTVWVGPLSGETFYGFANDSTPQHIMIAGWKSVDVSYGELYAMMLMDESIFENLLAALHDGKSNWYLFTADQAEIYSTSADAQAAPEQLISQSNSGKIFQNEDGNPVCSFSMTMSSPDWTIVREVSMDPARDVGGDFYDFFFIDEDHLCLVIADVSDKGIPAALFMMFAKRIIEDFARMDHGAGKILEQTNDLLCDNNQAEMFVTVWLGILEISTGRMTCSNAGHEYPAICKKGGAFKLYKDRHSFVVGGMEGVPYKEYTLVMEPGDKLFVYTDGVPEAIDRNDEMFGVERMVEALNTNADGRPDEIMRNVRSAVDAFVGDAEKFDDLTMMCIEYRGSESAPF